MTDLLTVAQVARALGISGARVRQLLASGRLPGFRLGKVWAVHAADLAAFQPQPAGWPKGRSRKSRVE